MARFILVDAQIAVVAGVQCFEFLLDVAGIGEAGLVLRQRQAAVMVLSRSLKLGLVRGSKVRCPRPQAAAWLFFPFLPAPFFAMLGVAATAGDPRGREAAAAASRSLPRPGDGAISSAWRLLLGRVFRFLDPGFVFSRQFGDLLVCRVAVGP